MYLYEKINGTRELGFIKGIPKYIPANLNPEFEMRPYQNEAFENFIAYFENDTLPQKTTQYLFHMATGSGKTLIMAGLMLYLYKKGYRRFAFFVNSSNILQKTKENFLNSKSSKYLFGKEINIDCDKVPIKGVENFQSCDDKAINICFTTIQKLHADIWDPHENALGEDDFKDDKVVLISDEAHHLNADTKKGKDKKEEENHQTWEATVKRLHGANKENVLLEFTATCDLQNALIAKEYEDKIVFDYPLAKFREDGYSKEIKTLRTDLDVRERALQALILSQYRYKLFQENRQDIKPVVFFKSKLIKENQKNMDDIIDLVKQLTGDELKSFLENATSDVIKDAHGYFIKKGISYNQLASELKADFSEEHCISANDDKDIMQKQILLNTLEDKDNPYRAVFAVDKLNEGWDVLNLFDIVRLYETRDGKNGKPGKTTMQEAQLIGRGARYCPFKVSDTQEKFKRKYDSDIGNPLRMCETLYYHCWDEPRYVSELHTALRETGINLENIVEREYVLKEDFKKEDIYKEGYVFVNERFLKSRNSVTGLPSSVRDKTYNITLATGRSGEDVIMEDGMYKENNPDTFTYRTTIGKIAGINPSIVKKAMNKYPILSFDKLHSKFPSLDSTETFINDSNYLGEIQVLITSRYEEPTPEIFHDACIKLLEPIANGLADTEDTYEGSKEFSAKYVHDIFKNKKCKYDNPHDGGVGISQNDFSVDVAYKIDLSKEDWFAFEDNFGTSEEKAFVAYFKTRVPELKKKYDKVFLLRNEKQLKIYSFDEGKLFEPDFVLFLQKVNTTGYDQLQVFIEPKGSHLLKEDAWKEDFLLQLEKDAFPAKKLADNNNYEIWGVHFFNRDERDVEFNKDFDKICAKSSSTSTTPTAPAKTITVSPRYSPPHTTPIPRVAEKDKTVDADADDK